MKAKKITPTLRQQLSEPLRDFVADFKAHGKTVLEQVRQNNPEKYLELSTKLLPLVAALNPGADDFADCRTPRDLGIALLKSVRVDEYEITEDMIAEALKCNDNFINALQAIRAAAEGQMQ